MQRASVIVTAGICKPSMARFDTTTFVFVYANWSVKALFSALRRGSEMIKWLPRPGILSTLIVPPCCSMMLLAMERPSPIPG